MPSEMRQAANLQYKTMLSSYSWEDYDALETLKISGLHRWNGAVALYQTGLPSQDAMLVDPLKSDAVLRDEITEFFRRMRLQKMGVMGIRLNKPGTALAPSHAGLAEDPDAIIERLRRDIAAGFVPGLHLWSDYRYDFQGAMSITFIDEESLVIDMVGPGYDGVDLSRGQITPPVVISTKPHAPPFLELVRDHRAHLPFYLDIKDEARTLCAVNLLAAREERRAMRMEFLAKMDKRSVEDEERWIREKGYTLLFERDVEYSAEFIMRLFDFAAQYAEYRMLHNHSFATHALNCHIARDGRILFDNMWDKDRGK